MPALLAMRNSIYSSQIAETAWRKSRAEQEWDAAHFGDVNASQRNNGRNPEMSCVPFSLFSLLIRLLLEVGIYFIYYRIHGRRAIFPPASPQCQSCRLAAG